MSHPAALSPPQEARRVVRLGLRQASADVPDLRLLHHGRGHGGGELPLAGLHGLRRCGQAGRGKHGEKNGSDGHLNRPFNLPASAARAAPAPSRPISSSAASMDGVCVPPVTITRSGMASFGILRLLAFERLSPPRRVALRSHGMLGELRRELRSAGRVRSLSSSRQRSAEGCS